MTSSVGLQRFIISSYPSTEINFVEIHLCMLQRWLLKQSWKQTPCGGKEGGEQGEKKKKKRKKTLAPAHRNQAVFCDTQKKKRVVSAPPEVTQQNRYYNQAAVCAVLSFLTSEERKDASLESMNRWKVSIHKRISKGYHRPKCLLECLSDFHVKLLYLVQSIESSEKS